MATIKDVAKAAGVSTATVSAVINETAYVSPSLRQRVLVAIDNLRYAPMHAAQNLKRKRSQLIALVVADLANPFFAKFVWAAEAAVADWGYSLVVFNSDEKPDNERRILARIRDPVLRRRCPGSRRRAAAARSARLRGQPHAHGPVRTHGRRRSVGHGDDRQRRPPARQVVNYLLDLGHKRIGTITGPLYLTTGRGRLEGLLQAMQSRGLAPEPGHVRSGEFREDVAYSIAREILERPDRPTALYVANGVMALGVMRALADLGLKCPEDISIASTDTISGIGGLKPRLTRTEHPIVDMTNEALRLLVDRINRGNDLPARNVVFEPSLVLGESCAPLAR